MEFTIEEKTDLKKYYACITCDSDLTNKLNSDGFIMMLRDILSNEYIEITKDDISHYGMNSTSSEPEEIIIDSLTNNGGLLFYCAGNKLHFYMLTRCNPTKTGVTRKIGFNNTEISIYFNGRDGDIDISFYAKLLPYFHRDEEKPLINLNEASDPILYDELDKNIRPDFIFQKDVPINCTYIDDLNTENWMYVNTSATEGDDKMVPLYVSYISAFYQNDDTNTNVDNVPKEYVKLDGPGLSYILDERTGTSATIPHTFELPKYSLNVDINDDYQSVLYYKRFCQLVYRAPEDRRENVLVFEIGTASEELPYVPIEPDDPPGPPPTPQEPTVLKPVQMICCLDNTSTQNYVYPCKKYTGNFDDLDITDVKELETTINHELKVYEKEHDKNEKGLAEFLFINPNATIRSTNDVVTFKVYVQNSSTGNNLAYTIVVGPDGNTITKEDVNTTCSIKEIESEDYFDTGWINFLVVDITLDEDTEETSIYIHAELTPGETIDPLLYIEPEGWKEAECGNVIWKRDLIPFIPNEWEMYKGYVIFTKSSLYLNGAYVGVKAVYATGIIADNQCYIESELFCECTDLAEGKSTYGYFENANWQTRFTDKKNNGNDNDGSTPIQGYGSKYVLNPNGGLSLVMKTLNNNTLSMANNNAFKSISEDSKINIAPVPGYTFNYLGGDDVHVDNGTTKVFDAKNGIDDYGALTTGNNSVIEFEPGEYHFSKIEMGDNVTIKINDVSNSSLGYVRICCTGRITSSTHFDVNNINNDFMSFMLYTSHDGHGDNAAIFLDATSKDNWNYGVIVAPYGEVHFQNTIKWCGAIWANKLSMANGCEFYSGPDEEGG